MSGASRITKRIAGKGEADGPASLDRGETSEPEMPNFVCIFVTSLYAHSYLVWPRGSTDYEFSVKEPVCK